VSDFEYSAITSNNLFTNAGGFLAKVWDALSYTKPFDCCGDNGCMWYMRSLIRFARTAVCRFEWSVSDYPSWTIPSITSMNSFECNKRCPLRIQRLSSNWRWTCDGWLAVWSWYFGFVILTSSVLEFTCCLVRAIRTGTKMGSGTHSCRYLLQSNQYCNLFGLAKWISVNLNQTKCNATW